MNDLEQHVTQNTGRESFKWAHYFDIYDRHFSRCRGTDVHVVEIRVSHAWPPHPSNTLSDRDPAARRTHVTPRNRLSSSDAHWLPTIGARFALTLTTVSLRTSAHLAAGRCGHEAWHLRKQTVVRRKPRREWWAGCYWPVACRAEPVCGGGVTPHARTANLTK